MKPITQDEVNELKKYLWGKIDCLRLENAILKVGLAISLIVVLALVMVMQYHLTGSIL